MRWGTQFWMGQVDNYRDSGFARMTGVLSTVSSGLEFDEAAVEELLEEVDDVVLDDARGGLVGLAEGGNDWIEVGGLFEETPDVRSGFAQPEALARLEGHEYDFGTDCGLYGAGAADYRHLLVDSHALGLSNHLLGATTSGPLGDGRRCRRKTNTEILR